MRIAIFAVFLVTVTPALAIDLRGIELGQPCRHVAEVEVSLGAKPHSDIGSMLSFGVLSFEDQSIAGRHARYLYGCSKPEGLVSSYSITVRTQSEMQARAIYAEAKGAVVLRLGSPQYDSDSVQEKERFRLLRLKGTVWFYAVANWSSEEHQAVSLGLEKDEDTGEWGISTSVFYKSGESPNSSLERTRDR